MYHWCVENSLQVLNEKNVIVEHIILNFVKSENELYLCFGTLDLWANRLTSGSPKKMSVKCSTKNACAKFNFK